MQMDKVSSICSGRLYLNWKFWLGIGISVFFLFLAFRKVNLHELRGAVENANYIYLMPAVLLTILSLWIRAFRWQYILQPVKEIRVSSLFSATMIGFMANNLLPARLGEFVRAYVIGQRENISKSSSFSTIVVERIFDGLTLLSFLAIVLILFSFSSLGWLRNAAYIALFIYLFALGFLILLKVQTKRVLRCIVFISKPLPKKARLSVIKISGSFVDGLKILHNTKNIIASAILSLFVWLPSVFVIYFLLISFGIHLPVYASFVLMVILCIGGMIPSAPSFVGTMQFFCVVGLSLFAVSKSQALGFSIIYHASQFIPVTIIGFVYLFIEGMPVSKIRGYGGYIANEGNNSN